MSDKDLLIAFFKKMRVSDTYEILEYHADNFIKYLKENELELRAKQPE